MRPQKRKKWPIKTNMPTTEQAHLGDMAGSAPDHRNKVMITIKPVVLFLLVEVLAFSL